MRYLISMLPLASSVSMIGAIVHGSVGKAIVAGILTVIYLGIAAIVWVGHMEDVKLKSKR